MIRFFSTKFNHKNIAYILHIDWLKFRIEIKINGIRAYANFKGKL